MDDLNIGIDLAAAQRHSDGWEFAVGICELLAQVKEPTGNLYVDQIIQMVKEREAECEGDVVLIPLDKITVEIEMP